MLTQAMLGFLPDAPRNKLYVDPLLPEWLPDLTIKISVSVAISSPYVSGVKAERHTFRLLAAIPVLSNGVSSNRRSPADAHVRTNLPELACKLTRRG